MNELEKNYLHWLPEEDADTKIELGLIRMMNENREIALTPPVLPRVEPSKVIDGEWYWVSTNGGYETYGWACKSPSGETVFWMATILCHIYNTCSIWGPVPDFTLEGRL